MNLKHVVDRWAAFVQQITQDKYGYAPEIRISGHVNSKFPYIEMPLDYILPELLKNAVRATIEAHPGVKGKNLPPIYVTIANNPTDFIIKISDRGGGIRHDRYVSAQCLKITKNVSFWIFPSKIYFWRVKFVNRNLHFCPKIQLWFPEKIVDFLGGEKLVKLLWFCTL